MYITASANNEATSASAPTTGLRWRMTTNAKMTATAAKKKKTANSIMLLSTPSEARSQCAHRQVATFFAMRELIPRWARYSSHPPFRHKKRHQEEIGHRQRQEHLPAHPHQDVVLQA